MPLMEYLMTLTFRMEKFIGWSWYPLVVLVLMGGALIFLAVCRRPGRPWTGSFSYKRYHVDAKAGRCENAAVRLA